MISPLLAKHSRKGACLLPSPNSILFALAIFKHICCWRLKLAISLSLATVRLNSCLKWINAEAGRTVFVLLSTGLGLPDVLVVAAESLASQ